MYLTVIWEKKRRSPINCDNYKYQIWQPTRIWIFILIFLSLNSEPELLNLEDIRFVWSGGRWGYWSLWRNETALHSPQSELDQGFLELQIVNDKSCATKNLWREGGSAVVLASMLYHQPWWQWVYYSAFFLLGPIFIIWWPNTTHIKDFFGKKGYFELTTRWMFS